MAIQQEGTIVQFLNVYWPVATEQGCRRHLASAIHQSCRFVLNFHPPSPPEPICRSPPQTALRRSRLALSSTRIFYFWLLHLAILLLMGVFM